MPPMATDPNTVDRAEVSAPKIGNCNSSSSVIKHVAPNVNGDAIVSQIKLTSSYKKGSFSSSQLPCTNCKKTISCDSRKERSSLRRLQSGTYIKFSDVKPFQCDLRTRNSQSSISKVNNLKHGRGTRQKVHKLNSSCERVIYSKERKEFVEDLVSRFEKVVMDSKKNEVRNDSEKDELTRLQLNSSKLHCASDSNLCQVQAGTTQSSQSAFASVTNSASPVACLKQSPQMPGFLLPGTCKTQNCKCPGDPNESNVPLFKSSLLYNDCSDSASSRVTILASCVNEYIKSVFQQLDHQNRGSISIEEFECLCRVLEISSGLGQPNKRASWVNTDGRIELSGFEKLIWKCVTSENQKLPVSLEERRSSAVLAHSVLSASRRLQSLENITDDLRGISKSMATNEKLTRAVSDEALPKSNGTQLLERNDSSLESLKEFSESSIVCYEENKRMKSIIEDLRKALQASDAENLALKVKIEMLAETLTSGERNLIASPQKCDAGRKFCSKSDFPSAKENHRLSVDSTYSSGRSNQSTPLWTRKRQFFDELMSHYQPVVRRDERCDTSLSDSGNRDSISTESASESEESYLCMDVIPGRLHFSKPPGDALDTESIYAPLGESPMSYDYIFKVPPKPSPRKSKTQGIGYSPNRERLYRSGLSRKSSRLYENFLPPTPPSIDSIPKRPSLTLQTSNTNKTNFQRVADQKEDSNSGIKEGVAIEAREKLHNQSRPQEVRNNGLYTAVYDDVQLKKETEIDSNTLKANMIACKVTTFSNNCSFTQPVNRIITSTVRSPCNKLSYLRPSSVSVDELDRRETLPSSSNISGVYQSAELLQTSKSLTSVTDSLETPANSCLMTKSALKKFMRQRKGVSVPELSSFNSGWHTTLRHSASHLQDGATPHPPASNGPNARKLSSQPLPQLLATKAMLEATLNAVLLNNRLIADHGVRSLTPETLRRRPEPEVKRILFPGLDTPQSRDSTRSSAASDEENRSLLDRKSINEFVGSDQLNQLAVVKAEGRVKSDEMKDFNSLSIKNFSLNNGEDREEKDYFVSKDDNSALSKIGEKLSLCSIPEFAENNPNTVASTAAFSKLDENLEQTDKNSPVPSSVDELLAELTDYCKEAGVDIPITPSNGAPIDHFEAENPAENTNELQLYTLDETVQFHEEAREAKETTAVCRTGFELAQEHSAHTIKGAPTEEIYISSSGSDDSGRGDSEGSCSSPEDLSGGSDDGLWTAEDDSPSSDIVPDCKRFREQGNLACYFLPSKLSADIKVAHINGHDEENPQENHGVLHRFGSGPQPCNGCGRASCNCSLTSQKVASVRCSSSVSYDWKTKDSISPKNIHDIPVLIDGSSHTSENELSKEVYDNIDLTPPLNSKSHVARDYANIANKEPAISNDTALQIIDLDREPEGVASGEKSGQKLTSEKDFQKPKGFLGRRCRSFNTFRSFLSHTASQLKRNSSGRSSFSLPRVSTKTYDDFSIGITGKEPLKSIVKRPLSDYKDQKKKKRISFRDTVDVFPIKCQGITSKVGEDKPIRFEKHLCDASENFTLERNNEGKQLNAPKNDADVSLITYVKVDQPVTENSVLNSVKTMIPVNHNNVTLVSESNDSSDSIFYSSTASIIPVTSSHDETLRREEAPGTKQINLGSLIPLPDVEVAKAKHTPESRALLEALEDDLEVILKALTEDESKIL